MLRHSTTFGWQCPGFVSVLEKLVAWLIGLDWLVDTWLGLQKHSVLTLLGFMLGPTGEAHHWPPPLQLSCQSVCEERYDLSSEMDHEQCNTCFIQSRGRKIRLQLPADLLRRLLNWRDRHWKALPFILWNLLLWPKPKRGSFFNYSLWKNIIP